MYLSQLILNPQSRQVRLDLSNPYELHRTVMRAFPNQASGGPGRVLYRLEQASRHHPHHQLKVLVQSEKIPDWAYLEALEGYVLDTNDPNPKPFEPEFKRGQRLCFRLLANPTVKRGGKRYGLYTQPDQEAWLTRKGEHGGFALLDYTIYNLGLMTGADKTRHHSLKFVSVRFEGLLQVIQPAQFAQTIRAGIGSAKGFGFGLLSLAPAL